MSYDRSWFFSLCIEADLDQAADGLRPVGIILLSAFAPKATRLLRSSEEHPQL
jgi:hypothetical protein